MQKMTIVLGLILIITAVATGVPRVGNCESRGGVQIGAQCLEFNVQKQSWSRAKAECESRGNKLASLKDLRMVMNYRSRAFGHTGFWDANFWVGGSDRSNEGTWEWLDGTRFDNSFWSPGEPNGGRNENCLMTFNNTGFNDWECDGARIGFICEIENTVTPNPGPTTAQPPNHVPTTAEPGTSDKFCDSIVIKENTWHEGWSGHMLFSPSGDVDGWEATITFDSYVDKFETQQGDMLLSTSGTSFKIKNKSWNAIPQTLPMKIGILYRFTSGSPAPKVVSIKFNDEILCGLDPSSVTTIPAVTTEITTNKPTGCSNGFKASGSSKHFCLFNDKQRTWSEADKKCTDEGMILAKVDTNPVEVRKYLVDTYGLTIYNWLGGKADGSNVRWVKDNQIIPSNSPYWRYYHVNSGWCVELLTTAGHMNMRLTQPLHISPCTNKRWTLCEVI